MPLTSQDPGLPVSAKIVQETGPGHNATVKPRTLPHADQAGATGGKRGQQIPRAGATLRETSHAARRTGTTGGRSGHSAGYPGPVVLDRQDDVAGVLGQGHLAAGTRRVPDHIAQ
jgi:hypothetical protein